MQNGRTALGTGAAEATLAAQPLARSALGVGAAGAYNMMAEAKAARNVRHRPYENAELPFSPKAIAPVLPFSPKEVAPKKPWSHLLDAKLDQICCEKEDF